MSDKSKIQWTEATINLVVGCTKVSPGCDHCYAERLVNTRQSKNPKSPRFGITFEHLTFHEARYRMLNKRKPTRFFVNSMSDLFHRNISESFIAGAYSRMEDAHQHTFQILTKRPERMRRVIPRFLEIWADGKVISERPPAPNIWLGVSIENNDYAWRAAQLRNTPAAVRFLSLEPLLGPIDFDLAGMHWVIVGGESGPGHRPMDLGWARDLRDRCRSAGVAFFFKQVAARQPTDDMIPEDLRIREYPQ
jgi:protein gp37